MSEWRLSDSGLSIEDESGEAICVGVNERDLRFILRACGSHDDLLKVCEKLVTECESAPPTLVIARISETYAIAKDALETIARAEKGEKDV